VKTVGVLALQGDFEAHRKAVELAGGHAVEVRTAASLDAVDGLIIPGGESTTLLRLIGLEQLEQPIRRFAAVKPVFGTCAGAILLARRVTHPEQPSLGLIDIDVERNAYGRQLDSRIVPVDTVEGAIEAVFIRAPIIRELGEGVRTLAIYQGDPVWVEQGRHMATTFHPELSATALVHRRFLSKL
jgi:5'-phosphate synthase pdxT subunit